jgi:hypothetical protein
MSCIQHSIKGILLPKFMTLLLLFDMMISLLFIFMKMMKVVFRLVLLLQFGNLLVVLFLFLRFLNTFTVLLLFLKYVILCFFKIINLFHWLYYSMGFVEFWDYLGSVREVEREVWCFRLFESRNTFDWFV